MRTIWTILLVVVIAGCTQHIDAPYIATEPVFEEPVAIEETYENKASDCVVTDQIPDDGIGGTGCKSE